MQVLWWYGLTDKWLDLDIPDLSLPIAWTLYLLGEHWTKESTLLGYGVMAAHKNLALVIEVRSLVAQHLRGSSRIEIAPEKEIDGG